jgi:hypothetical protein
VRWVAASELFEKAYAEMTIKIKDDPGGKADDNESLPPPN